MGWGYFSDVADGEMDGYGGGGGVNAAAQMRQIPTVNDYLSDIIQVLDIFCKLGQNHKESINWLKSLLIN